MKKKILFSPNQVGLAHIIRSLAIAEALTEKYDVYFVLNKKKARLLDCPSEIKLIHVDESEFDNKEGVAALFKNKAGTSKIKHYIETYRQIIKETSANLIVLDTDYFSILATIIENKKHVSIINSVAFPYRRGFVGEEKAKNLQWWIHSKITQEIANLWLNFFYFVGFSTLKKYNINKFSINNYLETTQFIIPEFKGYNILKRNHPNFHFVGPLLHPRLEIRNKLWEQKVKALAKNKKIVYVTFGGTGFGEKLFTALITRLLHQGYFVIASTGTAVVKNDLPLSHDSLFLDTFVPGLSATALSDVVISHGSYGTIIHCILAGKPIIGIPFNLEQIFHSLKVVDFDIGKSTQKLGYLRFLPSPDLVQSDAERTDIDKVLDMIKEVIQNDKYRKKSHALSKKINISKSLLNSLEIIEKLLKDL